MLLCKNTFNCNCNSIVYTKITKNVNFEVLANVTPFLLNRKILGVGQLIEESLTFAYLCSLKILPIDSLPQTICRPKFSGHFNFYFRIYRYFKLFSKKNSTAVISVLIFCCSRFTGNLFLPRFLQISGCSLWLHM